MADGKESSNREIGEITAHIEYLRDAILRVEGKQDAIMLKVPEFQSRHDDHDRQFQALWKWKDEMPTRVYALVGIVAVIMGGVVYVMEKLHG